MNWNGPAKGRERLGFSDFINVHTKGSDEEISLEVGVGEVAARRWGHGAVGGGGADGGGASLKEMWWGTARRRWLSRSVRPLSSKARRKSPEGGDGEAADGRRRR
jgi:hypothetical protein